MRAKSNSWWKFLEEMRGWRTQKHTLIVDGSARINAIPTPTPNTSKLYQRRYPTKGSILRNRNQAPTRKGELETCDRINTGSNKLAELLARFKQQDWTVLLSCRQNLRSKHKQLWQKERMPSTTRLTPWKAWPYARMRRRTHVRRAAMNRSRSVIVKANDTNVVVIAISTFTHIAELGLTKMWIAFGQAVCTHEWSQFMKSFRW